jgi:hypothetical protein
MALKESNFRNEAQHQLEGLKCFFVSCNASYWHYTGGFRFTVFYFLLLNFDLLSLGAELRT